MSNLTHVKLTNKTGSNLLQRVAPCSFISELCSDSVMFI